MFLDLLLTADMRSVRHSGGALAWAQIRQYALVAVTRQTRYGGVYEGGAWASFDVEDWSEVPDEAFAGDTYAAEWWWHGPSIRVAVGDSKEEAELRLARQAELAGEPEHGVGSPIRVTERAPSDWGAGEVGTLRGYRREPFEGRYSVPGTDRWIYLIEMADGRTVEVPEPYVRPVEASAEHSRSR
jgi:hypothetical protein